MLILKNRKSAFSLVELSIVLIVIGLLVAGVAAGKILVDSAKLSSARSLSRSSVVSQIDGLALWLDAVNKDSFAFGGAINDGDDIATWLDVNPISDFKSHGTLTEPGTFPTYKKDGINGLPAVSFVGKDGTTNVNDGFFLRPSLLDHSFTYFMVVKSNLADSGNTYNYPIKRVGTINPGDGISQHSGQHHIVFVNNDSQDFINAKMRNQFSSDNVKNFTSDTETAQPLILSVRAKKSGPGAGSFDFYLNSILNSNVAYGNYQDASVNDALLVIGNSDSVGVSSFSGLRFNGLISELIFYDGELSESDIEKVHQYLNDKWGVY